MSLSPDVKINYHVILGCNNFDLTVIVICDSFNSSATLIENHNIWFRCHSFILPRALPDTIKTAWAIFDKFKGSRIPSFGDEGALGHNPKREY
jgi:hypothetical protein